MKLTLFTDFGLRILMYLAQRENFHTAATTTEWSKQFGISRNHLVKVIQFLSKHKVLRAQRGRGLRLAMAPEKMKVGQLVHPLEQSDCVIDCNTGNCVLDGNCLLKLALSNAFRTFFHTLDQYTQGDISSGKTGKVLLELPAYLEHVTIRRPDST